MNKEQSRVALLIDTDNISGVYADELFKRAAAYGNVIVRKGYGQMYPYGWKKEVALKYAIEPVARFANVKGKNVTDIALVIDAMELAYQNIADVFCIASNDSDFSLLAMKLREKGVTVYGFGRAHAHPSFVASCDEFVHLPDIADDSPEGNKSLADSNKSAAAATQSDMGAGTAALQTKEAEKIFPPKETLQKNITEACDFCGDDSGWAFLSNVGAYLKRIYPSFTPSHYGHPRLLALVESLDDFEIEKPEEPTHQPKIRKKEK